MSEASYQERVARDSRGNAGGNEDGVDDEFTAVPSGFGEWMLMNMRVVTSPPCTRDLNGTPYVAYNAYGPLRQEWEHKIAAGEITASWKTYARRQRAKKAKENAIKNQN